MSAHELDNPFWSSLQTRHRSVAQFANGAARYPKAFAPFLGVANGETAVEVCAPLVEAGESVYLLGVTPRTASAWLIESFRPLAQMVCESPLTDVDGPPLIALDARHRADVLALTALVYPHYFRERTMDLGRYFGIYVDGRLAAMIGERLGTEKFQEISAVCTHPDFGGRGYARRLLAMLSNDVLAAGRVPFLHVSHENAAAKRLYERAGYRLRRDIGFFSLRRA